MASIQKKKRTNGYVYYIVQNYTKPDGKRTQHWIRCAGLKDAKLLLPEVENLEAQNILYEMPEEHLLTKSGLSAKKLLPPDQSGATVQDVVLKYMEHHSKARHWQAKTRKSNDSLCKNYIFPHIGDILVSNVTPPVLQNFYNHLQTCPSVLSKERKQTRLVSPRTIRDIHKLLRPAFAYAVVTGYILYNPANELELPKVEKKQRERWTEAEVRKAFRLCKDPLLRLMMQMQFFASQRPGEMLGMTWDCVHCAPRGGGQPYVEIKKELCRLDLKSADLTDTEIYLEFPSIKAKPKTALVLKKVKTDESERIVYIPESFAKALRRHKKAQAEMLRGIPFPTYDLVFCQENGRPIEDDAYRKLFTGLIAENNMSYVVPYSLRHSSATYKLRKSHNIKAVQGDMGHATPDMLLKIYAGIEDEERKKIAAGMDDFCGEVPETTESE